jgi:hypothetical protein
VRCEVSLADVGFDLDQPADAGHLSLAIEDEIPTEQVSCHLGGWAKVEATR